MGDPAGICRVHHLFHQRHSKTLTSKRRSHIIMLNNCILAGKLGSDPEVFYSSERDPVAAFNMAFQASKKKTG
jgi:hypothetical protein